MKRRRIQPRKPHPFGGCNRLLLHYRIIGIELLRYERNTRALGIGFDLSQAEEAFRIGVSFVPLEVLESYLEDIVDSKVSEERLNLRRGAIKFTPFELAITLISFTILGAACAWASRPFPLIASAIGAGVAVGAMVLFLPRNKILRRMRFAHIVTREISRRKGNMGTKTPLRVNEIHHTNAHAA